MKNSNKIRSASTALLLTLTSYMSGCSVVGLGVGTAIDSSKPDYRMVEGEQILSIKPGTKTTLHLESGSLENGKFAGYATMTSKEPTPLDPDSTLTLDERRLIIQPSHNSKSDQGTEYIPLRTVKFAEIKNNKHAKYIGLGIGLVIDIMISRAIDSFLSEPFLGP